MMQVSTLYAHSLERQLVTRRSQNIIKNLSRTCANNNTEQNLLENSTTTSDFFTDELDLTEAGTIPLTFGRSLSCPAGDGKICSSPISVLQSSEYSSFLDLALIDNSRGFDTDPKEFSDRLCKLPSQSRSGPVFGSPRRHSSMNATLPRISGMKLSQSAGQLTVSSPHVLLVKDPNIRRSSLDISSSLTSKATLVESAILPSNERKIQKKNKTKTKKERLPSNFMYSGTWTTKQHCDRLLEQVKSGDVLEFNIKFHHHWGIAVIPNRKKPTLNSLELIHLRRDSDNRQRVIKETLGKYWVEGVTARINNSKDVNKSPSSANEVVTTCLKLTSQPYREWQNSEQLIAYCRYGEKTRIRQMSDAAKWGSLSKYVDLWMNMVSSRHTSPATSPVVGRKRFFSVNF